MQGILVGSLCLVKDVEEDRIEFELRQFDVSTLYYTLMSQQVFLFISSAFLTPNFTQHGFGLARAPAELTETLQKVRTSCGCW